MSAFGLLRPAGPRIRDRRRPAVLPAVAVSVRGGAEEDPADQAEREASRVAVARRRPPVGQEVVLAARRAGAERVARAWAARPATERVARERVAKLATERVA